VDPPARPSLTAAEASLGHWAARLSWAARGAMERRLKPLGVTPPMMAALLALARGCPRAADVAGTMGVDAAAVTRLMDRLVEAGLVGRCELKGDRRSRRIELSPKALALLPHLQAVAAEAEAQLSEGLSPVKKAALIRTLMALTARAEGL
jgi:MarR family transcriptional regulator for hemolysin